MATNIYLGYPPENIKQWIIADAERKYQKYFNQPLTFTSIGDSSVSFGCFEEGWDEETQMEVFVPYSSFTEEYEPSDNSTLCRYGESSMFRLKLEYSIDNGTTWQQYTLCDKIELTDNQSVMFRSLIESGGIFNYDAWTNNGPRIQFVFNGNIDISGNIKSLLTSRFTVPNERTTITDYEFTFLFKDFYEKMNSGVGLKSAKNLILPSIYVGVRAFAGMFMHSTIEDASFVLPATHGYEECYSSMFLECTELQNPPKTICLEKIPEAGMFSMFLGCQKLSKAPILKATTFTYTDHQPEDYYPHSGCDMAFAFTNISVFEKLPEIPIYDIPDFYPFFVCDMFSKSDYSNIPFFTFKNNTFDEVVQLIEDACIFGTYESFTPIYSSTPDIEQVEIVCSDKTMVVEFKIVYDDEFSDVFHTEYIITEK